MKIEYVTKILGWVQEEYEHTEVDVKDICVKDENTLKVIFKDGCSVERSIKVDLCKVCNKPTYLGGGMNITFEDGSMAHYLCYHGKK